MNRPLSLVLVILFCLPCFAQERPPLKLKVPTKQELLNETEWLLNLLEKFNAKLDVDSRTGMYIFLKAVDAEIKIWGRRVPRNRGWIAEIRDKERATGFEFFRLYLTIHDVKDFTNRVALVLRVPEDEQLKWGQLSPRSVNARASDLERIFQLFLVAHLRTEHPEIISCRSQGRPGSP